MSRAIERLLLVTASTTLVLGALELGLRAAAHVYRWHQEAGNRAVRSVGVARPTVLCIGESTTALGGAASYPRQLAHLLGEHGHDVAVVNKGLPAITTDLIVAKLPEWIDEYQPRVVVAMMGVNDAPDVETGDGDATGLRSLRVYKVAAYIADGLRRRFGVTSAPRAPPESPLVAHAQQLLAAGRLDEARTTAARAVAERPSSVPARLFLARIMYGFGQGAKADALLATVAAEAPTDPARQVAVAQQYLSVGAIERARAVLEQAHARHATPELDGMLETVYYGAAETLTRSGQLDEAAALLDRLPHLVTLTRPYLLHRRRAFLARARRDEAGFRTEFETMARLLAAEPHAKTARNFATLRHIARTKGVRLVAVQYPLRRLEDLEEALEHDSDIVFVDNERVFRDAVAAASWGEYFTDVFAGDFGHLSPAGNRLLAENVARGVERALDATPSTTAELAPTVPTAAR